MLLDGVTQFTVIATGVCLMIGGQYFHMTLPTKKCALQAVLNQKNTENLGEELESIVVSFTVKTTAIPELAP